MTQVTSNNNYQVVQNLRRPRAGSTVDCGKIAEVSNLLYWGWRPRQEGTITTIGLRERRQSLCKGSVCSRNLLGYQVDGIHWRLPPRPRAPVNPWSLGPTLLFILMKYAYLSINWIWRDKIGVYFRTSKVEWPQRFMTAYALSLRFARCQQLRIIA